MTSLIVPRHLLVLLILLGTTGLITSMDVCSLCQCISNVVNCNQKNLSSQTEELIFPEYCSKADLSDNDISTVEKLNLAPMPKGLKDLDLSANKLETISAESFSHFQFLQTLILSNNLITALKNGTFKNLGTLLRLDLSFNRITSLPDGMFDPLGNLENLDLSFNAIGILGETNFMNLKKLKKLNLSFLELQVIHPATFDWKLTIEDLDLSHNYLTSVPTKALWYLRSSLKHFQISGNLIESLPIGSFLGLQQLRTLKLEQLLHLAKIESFAFRDLENLETVVLRYLPRIHTIDEKAFHLQVDSGNNSLCPIRDLTVEFTALSSIPKELLDWNRLRYISLRYNKWKCDCQIRWIKGSIIENLTGKTIYCTSPMKFRDVNIMSLNAGDLSCTNFGVQTGRGAAAVVLIIAFAVLISFATVVVLVYRRNGWILRPPYIEYNIVDSPKDSITIYDRTEALRASTSNVYEMSDPRNVAYIHDE